MKKQKRLSNKGFSLVELIIVIAIMAVLIGVLAPAYLSYVEKSRKTTDVQTVNTILEAMKTTSIDPAVSLADKDTITVKIGTTAAMSITSTKESAKTAMDLVLQGAKLKSSKWAKITGGSSAETITFICSVDGTGNVKFTCNSQGFANDPLTKDLSITYDPNIPA